MGKLMMLATALTTLAVNNAATAALDKTEPYKTLHIAADISGSNPLVASMSYAANAGEYVRKQVAQLAPGDSVHMSLIGSLEAVNAQYGYQAQVNRRRSAESIGTQAKNLIAALASGQIPAQGSTNILLYVEFGNFNCAAGDQIIVLTDGIESAEDISGYDLLEYGTGLPEADTDYLKGCTVTFYGLGRNAEGSLKTSYVRNLRNAWRTYFEQAGAAFTAIVQVN